MPRWVQLTRNGGRSVGAPGNARAWLAAKPYIGQGVRTVGVAGVATGAGGGVGSGMKRALGWYTLPVRPR